MSNMNGELLDDFKRYDLKDLQTKLSMEMNKGDIEAIELYLMQKEKDLSFYSYKTGINSDIREDLRKIVSGEVSRVLEVNQLEYNPMGCPDNHIEIYDCDKVPNYKNFKESLNEEKQIKQAKSLNKDNLYCYCIEFVLQSGEKILAIRRLDRYRKLEKGVPGQLIKGVFHKLSGELIGIRADIDLIVYQDKLLVLNHISLERIFDLEIEFKKIANEELIRLQELDVIEGFDEFKEDALDNMNVVKRLNKISRSKNTKLFARNMDKVEEVIERFTLDIKLNDNKDKIIYEHKGQIEQITLLMNDSYYNTVIGEKPGVDKLK